MADTSEAGPKLLFPFLAPFYDVAAPLAWPLVRVAVGWNFAVHGWGKFMLGADKVAPNFAALGFQHPYLLVYVSSFFELVGGVCIALGLFTRFFAAALAIELGYITFDLYWGNGFSWLQRGYEYTLMWGLLCFAISLRGGAGYSLDRLMAREL